MTDPDDPPLPSDSLPQPDAVRRGKARTTALVIRETDRMRMGIDADVLDLSMSSLALSTRGPFAVDEQVKIRLRNVVQRFEKEARGIVRKIDPSEDGSKTVGIELLTRLSALEVSLLKMGIPSPEAGPGSKWV